MKISSALRKKIPIKNWERQAVITRNNFVPVVVGVGGLITFVAGMFNLQRTVTGYWSDQMGIGIIIILLGFIIMRLEE